MSSYMATIIWKISNKKKLMGKKKKNSGQSRHINRGFSPCEIYTYLDVASSSFVTGWYQCINQAAQTATSIDVFSALHSPNNSQES